MPIDRLIIPASGVRIGFWHITESPEELLNLYTHGEHNEEIESMVLQRKSHFIASRLLAREFFPDGEIFKDGFGKPHIRDSRAEISWSHSGNYAALIANENEAAGIDIEQLSDRVIKIENKFCNKSDKILIDPGKHAESLLLIWTAKESLYKWYGRKEVDFKAHMTVEPFDLHAEGRYYARFHKDEIQMRFMMEYCFFNGHVASWVLGSEETLQASQSI